MAKRRVAASARSACRPKRARKAPARLSDEQAAAAVAQPARRKSTFAIRELGGGERPYRDANKNAPASRTFDSKAQQPLPKKKSGVYVFADEDPALKFRPNRSPAEVMQAGSFGGTYWRKITSAVTGETYTKQWEEFPKEWFAGLKSSTHLARSWKSYDKSVNKYGVKCGGTLDMWESSGWIAAQDPYGWFQWYCRYWLGRRSSDDQRQIKRWRGVCSDKGRFRNQLIGRCARGGKAYNDTSVSPVIRQALLHWGYELTEKDANAYVKLKRLPKLPPPAKE